MNRTFAGVVCGVCALLALAGCSNAGTPSASDGGPDGGLSYVSGPTDAGEGGADDAGDGNTGPSECTPPASATMVQQTEAGPIGCKPNRNAPFSSCDLTTTFKLVCSAPNPSDVPPGPAGCNLQPTSDPATQNYCCPCKM
jgi:hypothetical protein